jgi:hypothetical protein
MLQVPLPKTASSRAPQPAAPPHPSSAQPGPSYTPEPGSRYSGFAPERGPAVTAGPVVEVMAKIDFVRIGCLMARWKGLT